MAYSLWLNLMKLFLGFTWLQERDELLFQKPRCWFRSYNYRNPRNFRLGFRKQTWQIRHEKKINEWVFLERIEESLRRNAPISRHGCNQTPKVSLVQVDDLKKKKSRWLEVKSQYLLRDLEVIDFVDFWFQVLHLYWW